MLSDSKLQAILWTSRIAEAEKFYSEVLGLRLQGRSHGALVYNIGGTDLRVSPVPSTEPSAHTVMGFSVSDVYAVVDHLNSRGVVFERVPGFAQDAKGVVLTPFGSRVAWFRDPDGNILSVVQFGNEEMA